MRSKYDGYFYNFALSSTGGTSAQSKADGCTTSGLPGEKTKTASSGWTFLLFEPSLSWQTILFICFLNSETKKAFVSGAPDDCTVVLSRTKTPIVPTSWEVRNTRLCCGAAMSCAYVCVCVCVCVCVTHVYICMMTCVHVYMYTCIHMCHEKRSFVQTSSGQT
eukprot:COSAG06_NODE_1145_length_10532_cov_16.966261_6_plen_163_part_00